MNPEYNLICIPLDGLSPATGRAAFTVAIACELRFPQGSFSPVELAGILAQHPLLSGPRVITARAKPFAAWTIDPSMTSGDSFELTLTHNEKPHGSLRTLSEALSQYMGAPNVVHSGGVQHDPTFDLLKAEHFLDVAQAYDAFVELKRLLQRFTATVAPSTSIEDLALQPLRRLDSAIQEAILDAISNGAKTEELDSLLAAAGNATKASSLRLTINKIERRLTVKAHTKSVPNVVSGLASKVSSGIKILESSDPNVAIHAAFRNQLLASACGFVTYWTATTPRETIGDFVIQPNFPGGSVTVDVAASPTAFRRSSHTHPLAYGDVGSQSTTTCGLAALNSASGSARYRASSVNTEAQLVKDLLVQARNSLSSLSDETDQFGEFTEALDTRRPKILRDGQIGSSEPETPGITISAPVEDLVTPDNLRAASVAERRGKVACYFLDDLWIGFRLDLAHEKEGGYRSVHAQRQRIAFRHQGSVVGECEDFYDREQADDPARGYSSTEVGTFNGMSTAQAQDFRVLLGLEAPGGNEPNKPFEVNIDAYRGVPRLLFGHIYRYRLRSVFLGCIGLGVEDAPLGLGNAYVQSVPFYRARRFRPGELVASPKAGPADGNAPTNRLTIFLSEKEPKQRVTIVPTPIDIDTSRYYGLILNDESEVDALKGRRFVRDAAELFADGRGTMNYFFDPEVTGIIVRARVLNGGPRHAGAEYLTHDGAYCEVLQHVNLTPVRQRYGRRDDWQGFKPIVITFRTTTDSRLPSIESLGFLFDCHQVEVRVPPAFEMELSIIPDVAMADLERTSCFVSSSSQFRSVELGDATKEGWNPASALAEQILHVVHAVPKPLETPRITFSHPTSPAALQRATRRLDAEVAEIPGRVEVDAASTGQVHLQATWSDIDDNPAYESFALNSGQASTATHSVVFSEMPAHTNVSGFRRFVSLARRGVKERVASNRAQCAENKIFLGGAQGIDAKPAKDVWHGINFKDGRRKVAEVVAVGRSRFDKVFGESATEARSTSILIDVPSTIRMRAPRVSHILPLGKKTILSNIAGGSITTEYAFRIFLMRPWLQSGPGERLAIGCLVGNEANQVLQALDKTITQWGEDPVERPGLVISKRAPRASDFGAPTSNVHIDERIYPTNAERAAIIYRDNIPLPTDGPNPDRRLTVASYAVALDAASDLWFCDVTVAPEFFGWCGLALYRHQPNACEGRELSDGADWAYATVIHGDPFAWIQRGAEIRMTVGPCFDPYITYEFDSTAFKDGVSEDVGAGNVPPILLRRYQVGRAYYFEAAAPSTMRTLNLTKRRFGHGIASIPLAFD